MKKIVIVGASLAFAALPLFGAAADPAPITDTINVTVGETCTFESSNNGGKTYSLNLSANDVKSTTTSSTFTAVCNNASGFSVTATPTSITGAGAAITYSGTTPTAGTGTWTATNVTDSENIAASNGVLMSANGVTSGISKEVSYTVSTRADQTRGNYSGSIEYALTQN